MYTIIEEMDIRILLQKQTLIYVYMYIKSTRVCKQKCCTTSLLCNVGYPFFLSKTKLIYNIFQASVVNGIGLEYVQH